MEKKQRICVGIDPNMKFTALCKKQGNKILNWGTVPWTPHDYQLMYDKLSDFIGEDVDVTLVEQQMNQPMQFRSGVLTGMAVALGSRKVVSLNGHKYKNFYHLETGSRDTNKKLVVDLCRNIIDDYFKEKPTKDREHDLADTYFIASYGDITP